MPKAIQRSFFLLLVLSLAVSAQKAQPDLREQNLRRHVEYLASEKLEGRRTGEQGATFASGYIANTFAQMKLKGGAAVGNGKPGYLQPFPYVAGVELGSGNSLLIGGKTAALREGWMPLGYSPDADIPASPIVFAGYGISAADLKYDDYAGLDARGKIVLVLDGTPDVANPHSQFGRYNIHVKANIAKEKGARGLLIVAADPEFRNDRLAKLSFDRTMGETALPAAGVDRAQAASLLGLAGEKELTAFEKWYASRPAAASIMVRANLSSTAQLKIDLTKREVEAYNVIGVLEGRDPILRNEAIVIGAHYDHLGRGGQGSLAVNSSDIHYGADDNASGTAAVLELAREFAREKNNKRTMIFIAFSGEEEGLLGSKHYVNNPAWPLDRTVAMINLDMVGRLKDGKLNIGGIGTAANWRELVNAKNSRFTAGSTAVAVPVVAKTAASPAAARSAVFNLQLNEDGFGPSDHSSFYGKNIPVLFFFTGTHEDYHKPSDTFEKINYLGLTGITNFVAEIVRSIDQSQAKPIYTVARSSGVMGRSTGFTVSLGTVPSYADATDGMVLDGVRESSPAAKAGLRPGDKIVKLAGKDVRNVMDYTYIMGEMKAGEEYEVVLLRGTERLTLKIIPAPAARR